MLLSCRGVIFFCKQKTAYDLRISDWSSDVCSSDLPVALGRPAVCEGPGVDRLPHAFLEIPGGDKLTVPGAGELPGCNGFACVGQSGSRRRLQRNLSRTRIAQVECPPAETFRQGGHVRQRAHFPLPFGLNGEEPCYGRPSRHPPEGFLFGAIPL